MEEKIVISPVGFVKTIFKNRKDTKNRQIDKHAFIEVLKKYEAGLKGLEGFSYIVVVFYFHLSQKFELTAIPPRHNPNNESVGIFATHSPYRPNFIGVSVVKLLRINRDIVFIENKDMLNGTPVLDIKPYIPEKIKDGIKLGWYIKDYEY